MIVLLFFFKLSDFSLCRTSLESIVIQLKSLGIDNVLRFDFPSPPPVEALTHALEVLFSLHVLDDNGNLTTLGRQAALLPLSPQLAVVLLRAHERRVADEMLSIVAMLSVGQVFGSAGRGKQDFRNFGVYEGDHLTLLNVFNAFIAAKQSPQWCQRYG